MFGGLAVLAQILRGEAGLTLTTILGQISKQIVHGGKSSAVEQIAPLSLGVDQACIAQFLQMKGQGIRSDLELLSQNAGRQS